MLAYARSVSNALALENIATIALMAFCAFTKMSSATFACARRYEVSEMNLIDAIKSGKPWRRRIHRECTAWREPIERVTGYNEVRFELSDLLADDWEIQEPSVLITRADFNAAWEKASIKSEHLSHMRDVLAYELGLK